MRAFKQKMKLGRFSDRNDDTAREKVLQEEEQLASRITVGSRCQVTVSGAPSRRGTVMYVGKYIILVCLESALYTAVLFLLLIPYRYAFCHTL